MPHHLFNHKENVNAQVYGQVSESKVIPEMKYKPQGKPFPSTDGGIVYEAAMAETLFRDLKNKNEILSDIANVQLSANTIVRIVSELSVDAYEVRVKRKIHESLTPEPPSMVESNGPKILEENPGENRDASVENRYEWHNIGICNGDVIINLINAYDPNERCIPFYQEIMDDHVDSSIPLILSGNLNVDATLVQQRNKSRGYIWLLSLCNFCTSLRTHFIDQNPILII
ncbi:unnamed protein product [Lepeophtheirus salmonis]|uniref:(salmon louse) hypothetical protein n=1 Tax=Lepeophtheirus salmonis TaxID=72036 RepID=A0A7R8HDP3_LEPSM|nr:unnamed protein product [Lepeophtheirus salmonis]CAF3014917.1 unnamed protein product [Lepeophtheirus salmonis]